ncbi:hypothetical protein Tco_0331125 [Tanacetum coccineum]
MRTRSQSREQRPPPPEGTPVVIEPLRIEYPFQEDPTVEPMADTRTMAQLLQLVLLWRDKNKVCLLCEGILKQIPAFNFFCASLESIIAIENTWEWEKDVPDFEASRARGFCPPITRASHPQLHLGIQYPNLID